MLGVPIYPGAQFITSYDAGRGQRYYIFGSAAAFVDLVAYYRTVLKDKGELVFDVPATHEFDVGKFNENTMAFPPGVTIKPTATSAPIKTTAAATRQKVSLRRILRRSTITSESSDIKSLLK